MGWDALQLHDPAPQRVWLYTVPSNAPLRSGTQALSHNNYSRARGCVCLGLNYIHAERLGRRWVKKKKGTVGKDPRSAVKA